MNLRAAGLGAVPVLVSIAAAVLLGLGFVLQQRVARRIPHRDALTPRLIADLVGQPLWLAGVATMVGGQVLGAVALGEGSVSLIEPLLTTNLLFALVFARLVSREPLDGMEWCGAVALVGGVTGFLLAAAPSGTAHAGSATTTTTRQVVFMVAATLLAALLAVVAWPRSGVSRAALLAAAAGLLFGVQDGLTRGAMLRLAHNVAWLVTSWSSYAVIASAVLGLWLVQSAFEAAPLRASLPVVTAIEPLVGIGYGTWVNREPLRTSTAALVEASIALLAIVAGVILLARGATLTEPCGEDR